MGATKMTPYMMFIATPTRVMMIQYLLWISILTPSRTETLDSFSAISPSS